MKREEEIRQEVARYLYEDFQPTGVITEDRLSIGIRCAQWADEHPKNPWISVEDMLPEEHSRVLIMFCNGTVTYNDYIGVGDINYMKAHPEIITHWMPIPQIKKGE